MKRAVCAGTLIVTSAAVPVPLVTVVNVVPSFDVCSCHPRGKLFVVVPASSVTWVNVRYVPMSTWKNSPLACALDVVQRVVVLPSIALKGTLPDVFGEPVAAHPARGYVTDDVGWPLTFISSIDHVNAVVFVPFIRICRACCVAKLITTKRDVPVPAATWVNADPSLDTDAVHLRTKFPDVELPASSVIWLNVCDVCMS